jgi:hypothetical protein
MSVVPVAHPAAAKDAGRFLTQAKFGPTYGGINALAQTSYNIWLNQQVALPLDSHYDILNRNAFGNFRALLKEVSLSPAMGKYHSQLANEKEHPADGTRQLDQQGNPIPTYTQKGILGMVQAFTGLSWCSGSRDEGGFRGWYNYLSCGHGHRRTIATRYACSPVCGAGFALRHQKTPPLLDRLGQFMGRLFRAMQRFGHPAAHRDGFRLHFSPTPRPGSTWWSDCSATSPRCDCATVCREASPS